MAEHQTATLEKLEAIQEHMQAVSETTHRPGPPIEPTALLGAPEMNEQVPSELSQTSSPAEATGFETPSCHPPGEMMIMIKPRERGARLSEEATGNVLDAIRLLRDGQSTLSATRCHTSTDGDSRCFAGCPCSCHFRRNLLTQPDWFKTALGALAAHLQGSFIAQKCDYAECQGLETAAINLRYRFPAWLSGRGVDFECQRNSLHGGGIVSFLRFHKVISSCDAVWSMIRNGNIAEVEQRMVELGTPSILDENETSPLYVSQPPPRQPSRQVRWIQDRLTEQQTLTSRRLFYADSLN